MLLPHNNISLFKKITERLLKAKEKGLLTGEELEICTRRILELI